jgi:hypothetical protein
VDELLLGVRALVVRAVRLPGELVEALPGLVGDRLDDGHRRGRSRRPRLLGARLEESVELRPPARDDARRVLLGDEGLLELELEAAEELFALTLDAPQVVDRREAGSGHEAEE